MFKTSVLRQSSCKRPKSFINVWVRFASIIGMFLIVLNVSAQPPAAEANKFLGNITTNSSVRSDFMSYWNQITGENEHKWGSVEWSRGSRNWNGGDAIANFAKQNNIKWKFHTLVWGSQEPNWIKSLSTDQQLAAVEDWMDAAASRYPDVPLIDVVNEAYPSHAPASYKNALGGDGTTGYDWIIKAFQMARDRWPNAILIYNDYNNCEYDNEVNWTIKLVEKMLEVGAPIDAIGCQAHDAYKISTATVKNNIDKLAATGLPIYITEYDIGQSDDATQKKIMEEQFTMFWNHPKIVGVTYWGYVVGSTWRTGTGLMSSSGAERPALTWLKQYVKDNPNPPNDFDSTNITYSVSVSVNGFGTVTHDPEESSFLEETDVTFTATPLSEDWVFDSWSGDVEGNTNPLTVKLTKRTTNVIAKFLTKEGNSNLIVDDVNSWVVRTLNDASATLSNENGEYKIVIENAGDSTTDLRVYQYELLLEKGNKYRVVFDAYADAEKKLLVDVSMTDTPKTSFLDSYKEFNLTTSKETYSFDFKMTEETCEDSRLQFILGSGSIATVTLDNIYLYRIVDEGVTVPLAKSSKQHIGISQKGLFVNINISKMEKKGSLVTIYDMLGNVVRSENLRANGSSRYSLNIGNIPRGYYIVSVRNGNMLKTSKIISLGK